MNVKKIREDFPLLENNPGFIYLDSAATSLKPRQVIEAEARYYKELGSNTHRSSFRLANKTTEAFEKARETIAGFVGVKSQELVFTKNTTESINTIAVSLERSRTVKAGDEIVVSFLEHHSNLVPWQELCTRVGAKLKIVGVNEDYTLDEEDLEKKITKKTKVVAMAHTSNTVGGILPAKKIGKIAHENNALFLLDCAQSAPHMEVNLKKINADFAAFSGHKMLGPTGIGALCIKEELLEKMKPYNYGGGMISKVNATKANWAKGVEKFEAGTKPIAQAIGFAKAVQYLKRIGLEEIHSHEEKLVKKCVPKLEKIHGVKVYGAKDFKKRAPLVLFNLDGIDPLDLATAFDESANIAIRSGMHCAEPIVSSINKLGLARASSYLYSTLEEINICIDTVTAISNAVGKKT